MMKRLAGVLLLSLAACESQEPPAACGPIPQVVVNAKETATVTACFNDPNGDMLTYSVWSANPSVAMASISGTTVTVSAVAPGNASVTVTASDPDGLQGQQSFQVMVPNRAPVPLGTISSVTVQVGQTESLDVASYFTEPDGEAVTYGAASSNPAVATVSVSGSTVRVTAVAKGTTTVSVTVTDPGGLSATQTFQATVPNRAPEAVGTIPDDTVEVGDAVTVDLSPYFTDPDGDALAYTATSSATSVARVSVSVSVSVVMITAIAKGTADVTITATDTEGLEATQSFEVIVPNRAPVAGDPIPDLEVDMDTIANVNVAEHFDDPDGDPLTFAASSSSPAHASVSVSGSVVTVRGVLIGAAMVIVTASDPEGLTARQAFQVTVTNPDRAVLETVYDALGGDDWITNTNWGTDAPLDTWYGVTTNETGRVVALDLRENGLAGEIPAVVGRLRILEQLDLALNRVDENLPESAADARKLDGAGFRRDAHEGLEEGRRGRLGDPGRFSVGASFPPAASGHHAKSRERPEYSMALRSDGITGPIPRELGNLSNLKELWLAGNSLSGAIPRELENLSKLESLWLPSNSLTGTIPRGLGNLSNLEYLSLWANSLTGGIPPELGSLSRLRYLYLDNNELTGRIPRELGNLSNLEYLSLDNNELTGRIPRELGNLSRLELLRLWGNSLTGTIPPELGNLSRLKVLSVSYNELTGTIPRELGDLSNLAVLVLNVNSLTGAVPHELGSLSSLEHLYVWDNPLTGAIPGNFVDLSLTTFWWWDTDLCAPATSAFQDWLRSIEDHRGGETCSAATFDLEMAFTSSVSSTVRSHVRDARDEWEAVLEDTELDDITYNRTLTCGGLSGYVGTVDDHRWWVHVDSIDGEGGVLAYAGYCYSRQSDDSPILSLAIFDEADVEWMLDEDALVPVAFHELAHALGFSGYHWDKFDLVDKSSDPHFEGDLATDAFDDAGGDDYDGEKVPVQPRVYSHWRENVFQDEIMTPSINLRDHEAPISAITLQAMADIGYEVDVSRADDYELPDPTVPPPAAPGGDGRAVFDLSNDVVWGPVTVVDADGRVIRVIPPPPGSVRWPLPGREVRIEPSARPSQSGRTPPGSGSRSK